MAEGDWTAAEHAREKRRFIESRLRWRWVGLHSSLIFLVTWLAGWGASWALLQAGLIRLEQGAKPEIIGPALRAFIYGAMAVAAIQFLVMGSVYPLLGCSAYADITGALLTGLAPLMTAYLVVAAMASLLASTPEA